MNQQNLQKLPAIPEPPGWDRDWPFAAEVALWLIPVEERPSALAVEIVREREFELEFPWLTLSTDEQKSGFDALYGDAASFASRKAFDPVSLSSMAGFKTALLAANPAELEELHEWISKIVGMRKQGREPGESLLCDEWSRPCPFDAGNIFTVSVAERANVKAAGESFKNILKEKDMRIQKHMRGKKAFDTDAGLAAIALRRLRTAANGASGYWEPMEGTDLMHWPRNSMPSYIRDTCLEKIRHLERKYGLPES